MILYYSPGACSLADHIALHEAGLSFDRTRVDLKTKRTEDGRDYATINPKGSVPALQMDDGAVLTENVAVLSWIADTAPGLAPSGDMGRYRLLEAMAYISSEIHKSFKPFFSPDASDADKAQAGEVIGKRLDYLADNLCDDYLLSDRMSVADAYLFVMLTWARKNGLAIPGALEAYFDRVQARPAVQLSLQHEGLGGRS